jgi:hypothetical protein
MRNLFSNGYVASLGSNRGFVKVAPIAPNMEFSPVEVCVVSVQPLAVLDPSV